jgi:type IV secretion system protein VirD4
MNKIHPAQHLVAALALLLIVVAWLYLSSWSHVLFTHGPIVPIEPGQVYQYWQVFSGDPSFTRAKTACGFVLFTLWAASLFEIYKDRRPLHGNARFVESKREVKKAGLFAKHGILIGKFLGKYLVLGGQYFVLLAAPTRGGKGVSMVIPNLLNWMGSVICMDTKLENFNTTSAYRKRILKQEVFLFNPFASDRKTHCWNPLDEVRRDPVLMGGDVIQIAQIFYPDRAGDKNPFFTQQAQNLFFGLTLLLLETKHPRCTMAEVFRQGSGYDKPLREHLLEMLDLHKNLSRQCRDSLNRMLSNPDETFGNIKASFDAPLLMFANPLVDAATSRSDFKLSDVRRKRVSIYFGITPNRLVQAERLTNLFFTQAIALNTEVLPENDKTLRYECLLVNDEFTAFGRIAILVKAVSFVAGYNLRLLTIVQSKSQLQGDGLYSQSDARNLIVNHEVKVAFAPGDHQEAKEVSEMLGTYTTKSTSTSSSRSASVVSVHTPGTAGENTSDQRRALMMPQELQQMAFEHEIVDKKGIRPILADKILYYADPVFVDRLKQVSPSLRALGSALPTKDQLDQARLDGELAIPVAALFIDLGAGQNLVSDSDIHSASDTGQGGSAQLLQPKPVQSPMDPLVAAAARKLALDLADWSAFSTADEVKSHVLKTLFMQDFMGEKRHVSI